MADDVKPKRGWAALLAAIGGILIIIGGILGFFLSFAPNGYGPNVSLLGSLGLAIAAIILGIIIMIFSGYTHYQGHGRGWVGGIGFIVLGILAWVVGGAWTVILIGSILTILAGLIVVIMLLVHGTKNQTQPAP